MKYIPLLLILGLPVGLYHAKDQGYVLNVTPSLARGVYKESKAAPLRGDIVGFCLSGPWTELAQERGWLGAGSCPSGQKPLMKYLAGVPGDMVSIQPEGILCGPADGVRCLWSAKCLPEDSHGRAMPPSELTDGIIPEGKALVLTNHPGGFDSRYFGLVPFTSLTTYTPIFTQEEK